MLSCSCIICIAGRDLAATSWPCFFFFFSCRNHQWRLDLRCKGKELGTRLIRDRKRKPLWLEPSHSSFSPFSRAYGQCFLVPWHGHWLRWQSILDCWVFAQRIQVFSWKLWDRSLPGQHQLHLAQTDSGIHLGPRSLLFTAIVPTIQDKRERGSGSTHVQYLLPGLFMIRKGWWSTIP